MFKLLGVKEGLHEVKQVENASRQKASLTMFLDFGRVIPKTNMFQLDHYQEHVYCVPSIKCIPYVGIQEDIMDHMTDVELIPEALISRAR